jgi:hypothetical protein
MAISEEYARMSEMRDVLMEIRNALDSCEEYQCQIAERLTTTFDRISETLYIAWLSQRWHSVAIGVKIPPEALKHIAGQAKAAANEYLQTVAADLEGVDLSKPDIPTT